RWGGQRRWPCDQHGQPAEVLCDRCERELELSPARPAQSQAAEPQDALEMCKQHLNAFSIVARSLECFSLGLRASNVTSFLVNVTRHPAERRLWAAVCLQWAATAVAHAGHIQKCLAIIDEPSGRRECLAGWADVYVPLLIERKIVSTEDPILAHRLVDHRDVWRNLLLV